MPMRLRSGRNISASKKATPAKTIGKRSKKQSSSKVVVRRRSATRKRSSQQRQMDDEVKMRSECLYKRSFPGFPKYGDSIFSIQTAVRKRTFAVIDGATGRERTFQDKEKAFRLMDELFRRLDDLEIGAYNCEKFYELSDSIYRELMKMK